jgi:hypothetical protein
MQFLSRRSARAYQASGGLFSLALAVLLPVWPSNPMPGHLFAGLPGAWPAQAPDRAVQRSKGTHPLPRDVPPRTMFRISGSS